MFILYLHYRTMQDSCGMQHERSGIMLTEHQRAALCHLNTFNSFLVGNLIFCFFDLFKMFFQIRIIFNLHLIVYIK